MVSDLFQALYAGGGAFVQFLLHAVLLQRLCKSFNDKSIKPTPRPLKLTIISYFISSSLTWILLFILWLNIYLDLKNQSISSVRGDIAYILSAVGNVIYIINVQLFVYFLKLKLQHTYQNTHFAANHFLINTFFIITLLSFIALFSIFCIIVYLHYPDSWETTFDAFIFQYEAILIIYSTIILILFNRKLYQIISLTVDNNKRLSFEINETLKDMITKQTLLICIFIICLFAMANRLLFHNKDVMVSAGTFYYFMSTLASICAYLTFKFNNHGYIVLCKYCHLFCLRICTKLIQTNHSNDNEDDSDYSTLLLVETKNKHIDCGSLHIFDDVSDCYDGTQCIVIKNICALLKEHSKIDNNIEQYMRQKNYPLTNILDDFNHLLQCHDTENNFNFVYNQLVSTGDHSQFTNCVQYQRNFKRRLANDEEQKNDQHPQNNEITNILDKIHSFYYHSYDTFARNKKSDESKIIKTTTLKPSGTTKFNSDFSIKNHEDIYSFGQRFEYEESKNEWSVKPKYDTFKDELLNNKLCSITNDIYDIEHGKCKEFMNTNYVKKLAQRSKRPLSFHNIFSLLIYCNCDNYQNKWSATFRRIPSNEDNESLKQRHSYFYFSSLNLRNLVEYFGESLINNKNKTFYHGVSTILYFIRTTTQFNGPLSTSEESNVAVNFSKNRGVILELKYSFSTYPLKAKYFPCSFFSDYVNEKECLFIGGIPMMIVTNIINIGNGEIYKKYINALNVINCLLNGTYKTNAENYNDNTDALDLGNELLSHQNNEFDFPEYIVNLVHKYCMNLTNIMIFWNHMEMIEKLRELLSMDSLLFFDLSTLLNLFPNIEQIEYFNESLQKKNADSKKAIGKIIKYVTEYRHHNKANRLQCVVIHHKLSSLNIDFDKNIWSLHKQSGTLILSKISSNVDINTLNLRYNQINQGNTANNMLTNLL